MVSTATTTPELVGQIRMPSPAASVGLCHVKGLMAIWRGRPEDALAAFSEGERMCGRLRAPHFLAIVERQWQLRCRVLLGETEPILAALADTGATILLLERGDFVPQEEENWSADAVWKRLR